MAETTTQKSIDLFWDDVVSALEAKAGELPGLLEDDEVRHAIGDFRQRRLEEMRKHLVHDDPDRMVRLLRFLPTLSRMAEARIGGAEDADEVADAVMAVIDDFRRYLIAHDLLSGRYVRESERTSTADRWLSRPPHMVPRPRATDWNQSKRRPAGAAFIRAPRVKPQAAGS